jgi:endonuclease-3 related protein
MARRSRPIPAVADVYERLRGVFGHAGWWPGDSPFEVCLGAILVQNTAWANVERTLEGLEKRGLLSFRALDPLPPSRLAPLLRSSGTFRVKARRLRAFLDFLSSEYGGRAEELRSEGLPRLRAKLLEVPGVGPETADSIALYAAGHPAFVVDAYTRRVFARLGLLRGGESYGEVQRLFEASLPRDAALYNDYHAQIVRLGKDYCRVRPRCPDCPLADICRSAPRARGRVGARRTERGDRPRASACHSGQRVRPAVARGIRRRSRAKLL